MAKIKRLDVSPSSPGPNQVQINADDGETITSVTVSPSGGVTTVTNVGATTCNILNLASGSSYTITVVVNNQEYVYSISVGSDGTVTFN